MPTTVVDKDKKAIWNEKTGQLEIDDVPVNNATMIAAIRKAFTMGWGNEKIHNVICGPGWVELIDKERSKWDKERKRVQSGDAGME